MIEWLFFLCFFFILNHSALPISLFHSECLPIPDGTPIPATPAVIHCQEIPDYPGLGIHVFASGDTPQDMFVHLILGTYRFLLLSLDNVNTTMMIEFEVGSA